MAATASVAGLAAAIPGPGELPAALAALVVVPLALGGLGGALVSVLASPITVSEGWSLAPPEAQGLRLMIRTAWPPLIAVLGASPIVLARAASEDGRPEIAGAQPMVTAAVLLFALICGWVRVREDVAAWWKAQMAMAQPQRDRTTDDDQ
jgi:hypothetical protein